MWEDARLMTQSARGRVAFGGALLTAGVLAIAASGPAPQGGAQTPAVQRWYKGNLHTHTLNSDGDSTPEDVVRWYREHGYQFLVLTDHNFLTAVGGLNALHSAEGQFVVVPGEELSDRVGQKPIHVNGFDVERLVPVQGGATVVEMLQRMTDAIRAARGVPSINHPNYEWAITPEELAQIRNTRLFEVYNGHPQVNNLGGGGAPGLEEMWDRVLSSGKVIYGIAVDDAHDFKRPGDPLARGPGRGWVHVRADRLDARSLVDALERGDFYASTGVELQSVEASPSRLAISIKEVRGSKYHVQFIGRQGKVLSEAIGSPASYTIKGDEGYVRARIMESNGRMAWVQPIALPKP